MAFSINGVAIAADKTDWAACKPEIKNYCSKVSGEEDLYQCLQQHDSDLYKKCDAVHGKYEELTGNKK